MSDDALPEPDRIEGVPHPRHTASLHGHGSQEAEFLAAHHSGKLHHAWMLTGPRGVGKATLAWRIARWLIAQPADAGPALFGAEETPPADTLYLDAEYPVFRRVAALSEPRVTVLRRPYDDKAKRLKTAITVDEVRKLKSFFAMSSADGGWRVAIIDAMDELNVPAQNALLKLLEEPPARVLFLLVTHQPGRLLPTIRSRCRTLRLGELAQADLDSAMTDAGAPPGAEAAALASLSAGSVGEAVRVLADEGVTLYANLLTLLSGVPKLDRVGLSRIAESCAGKGAEGRYDLTVRLTFLLLARLARAGATGRVAPTPFEGEAELLARLAPSPESGRAWAELSDQLRARIGHARAVNLDPAQVMLDSFLRIDATARKVA
ncbi:DNA polymerase III subunit delta' [Pontivivens insulae]|uniref:DNA polymerase III subunit gamma/tau n=1 Tax=Pontivivens insulae TaxID=1639689 RepID=A0A2R8AF99_9RHOB|nr:DNA polymerase III subunit delta' [Pontivivens insulae]RED12167.1 DNA polymerase III delta prime subunit [Pontivivens insulae]SPF30923.1 DNA polymerase III subunit gamma/tau [Pontivivens insulae]